MSAPTPTDLARASEIQAKIHLKPGEPDTAMQALFQAQSVEGPSWIRRVYHTLAEIQRERSQPNQAARASAQEWRWAFPLAQRLDQASEQRKKQKVLEDLDQSASTLEAWLTEQEER